VKNQTAQLPFHIPSSVEEEKRVDFCIEVINKYRHELPLLRRRLSALDKQKIRSDDEIKYWKEKYKETIEELIKKEEENERLKQEIEKLAKTNNRYQIALFDHGNFKHRDDKSKKSKGGQSGHEDTNRENQADFKGYESYQHKRIYASVCNHCGNSLARAESFKRKVLLDIVIKPEIVKLLIESERQWCGNCQKEIISRDPQSLPFTEYGLNTFMLILVLRFKGHLSFLSISSVFSITFGLSLSKSDISNMLKLASVFLDSKYEELIKAVRAGEIIYADETGWSIRKQKAWLWIMASENAAVYFAAESRGKGIANIMYGNSKAFLMTDGYASYANTAFKDKHLFCWSHILRFAFEETVSNKKTSKACFLRQELVRIYHIKKNNPEYSREELDRVLRYEFDQLLNLKSDEKSFIKIQNRVCEQKEGLILALIESPNGTNNLAERELRPMVLNRHVSYGSDTYQGMKTSAILGSVMQTISKREDLLTELKLSLQIGIHEKYPQYIHLAYSDT
jgi:transposase